MELNKKISKIDVENRFYEPKKCVIDNISKALRECLKGTSFNSIDELTIKMQKDNCGNRDICIKIEKYSMK